MRLLYLYNDTFGYHILVSEGSSNMHIELQNPPHLLHTQEQATSKRSHWCYARQFVTLWLSNKENTEIPQNR